MSKPGRHWHYLAVEHTEGDESWLGMHEVYIDEDGKVHAWSVNHKPPMGGDMAELESDLAMMQRDVKRFGVIKEADLVVGLDLPDFSEVE